MQLFGYAVIFGRRYLMYWPDATCGSGELKATSVGIVPQWCHLSGGILHHT